jgi:hypothetical protein
MPTTAKEIRQRAQMLTQDTFDPFDSWSDAYLIKRIESARLDIVIAKVLKAENPTAWRTMSDADRDKQISKGRRVYLRHKTREKAV